MYKGCRPGFMLSSWAVAEMEVRASCLEAENRILFTAGQNLVTIPGSVDMKGGTITGKDEVILIDETCIKGRDDSDGIEQ